MSGPRDILESAHLIAAAATGRLALILSAGRGLTPSSIEEIAVQLESAAIRLRDVLGKRVPTGVDLPCVVNQTDV